MNKIEEGAASRSTAGKTVAQSESSAVIRSMTTIAVVSLAVLAVLYTMYFAAGLFLPIFYAMFLGLILNPVVGSLKYVGVPRAVGALIILVGLTGSIGVAVTNLTDPVEEWIAQLPKIQYEIEMKFGLIKESIEQAKEVSEKIQDIAEGDSRTTREPKVEIKGKSLLERAFQITWFTFIQVLITIALTFFFLARDTEHTKESIRRLPWRHHHMLADKIFEATEKSIARYLRVSAIIYAALGILTAVSMYFLKMPTPVLWGILAAILGFMPYVGPLIVFGSIGFVSLLTFDDWWQILLPPIVYGTLTVIEGYFITPTILGRRLTLSPIAIFISMLVWTWVWGMAGALLAVPILVVLVNIWSVLDGKKLVDALFPVREMGLGKNVK